MNRFLCVLIELILFSHTFGEYFDGYKNHETSSTDLTDLIDDIFNIPSEPVQNNSIELEHGGNTGDTVGNCKCLPEDQCGSSFLRIKNKEACIKSTDLFCCSLLNNDHQILTSTPELINTSSPNNNNTCGKHNPDGVGFKFQQKPHEAKNGEFPWMVSILSELYYIDDNSITQRVNVFKCGGSLIHPKVVLTSAKCVNDSDDSLFIRAGDWDTQAPDNLYPHQDRKVESVIIHERFHSHIHVNDIALLFLDTEVEITDNVKTICLKKLNFNQLDLTKCILNGWGRTEFNGNYATILKKIDIQVMDRSQCILELRKKYSRPRKSLRNVLCAVNNSDNNFCDGDEGGPLVCPIDGSYYQVGIAAKHFNCGLNKLPSLFVNVSSYYNWIHSKVRFKHLVL